MSDYIYAGTRARTLENTLLTETQREMLVGAKSVAEMYRNLHDTFLAPYLAEHDESELSSILEQSITDTYHDLRTMTPEPELLNILWLKYDFYNLRAIIKGDLRGLDDDMIKGLCFTTSVYPPEALLAAYRDDNLGGLDERLESARREAASYTSIADIDLIMNLHYLTAIRDMAAVLDNDFVRGYVLRLIDLFNLKAGLRLANFDVNVRDMFVEGGTLYRSSLENVDNIAAELQRYGGPQHWKEALEEYRSSGSFALIEKAADDYMNQWLKEQSYDIFSPAPLFAYFNAKKNNVQMIRAIYVGKEAGLEEHEIRYNLRNLYQ